MSREEQFDFITDLLTDFDEMGFAPTTTVPDLETYAIDWKNKLTNALQGYLKQSEGEWKPRKEFNPFLRTDVIVDYTCSCCGRESDDTTKFCPHCGAKMKGGAE